MTRRKRSTVRKSRKVVKTPTVSGWRAHPTGPSWNTPHVVQLPPLWLARDTTPSDPTIAQIFDTDLGGGRPSVTILDTGRDTIVLDEDEESDLFGAGTEGFDRPDLSEDEWTDGAEELIDQDVLDRRAHTYYSREEVSEYIDQLAEGTDSDISQLYDWYYGYGDTA